MAEKEKVPTLREIVQELAEWYEEGREGPLAHALFGDSEEMTWKEAVNARLGGVDEVRLPPDAFKGLSGHSCR